MEGDASSDHVLRPSAQQPGQNPERDEARDSPAGPGAARTLELRFTASGSEYFRIWIVNLLLIVVSLGLYLPFAKARRLRYFHANTLVDGQPLAFHGEPWKMFRGFVVMIVLFGAYAAASYVSDWVALGAFVLLAVLWPALWRSSLMFRLGNTSWRGLRMGFEGSLADAYRAMLPLFVPGFAVLALTAWFMTGVDPRDAQAVQRANEAAAPGVGMAMLLLYVLFPWAFWRIKHYQHGGYRIASEAAVFSGRLRAFYGLGLKLGVMVVLLAVLMGVLAAVAMVMGKMGAGRWSLILPGAGLGMLGLATLSACAGAWLQNLAWNHTSSAQLRFASALGAGALTRLTFKNLLLVVLTLGLYRPFAVVHAMRLRLQAISVQAQGDIDGWVAAAPAAAGSGSGEMSGDFFGIDVGL